MKKRTTKKRATKDLETKDATRVNGGGTALITSVSKGAQDAIAANESLSALVKSLHDAHTADIGKI